MLIDWVDIACWKHFNCYLSQLEISELSLSSKQWRAKLMPLAFRKIRFEGAISRGALSLAFESNCSYKSHQTVDIYKLTSEDQESSSNLSESSESELDSEKEKDSEYDGNEFGSDEDFCDCVNYFEGYHHYNCEREIKKAVEKVIKKSEKFRDYVTDITIYEDIESFPYQYHHNLAFIGCFSHIKFLEFKYTRFYLYQLNGIFSGLNCLESLILLRIGIIEQLPDEQGIISIEFPKSIRSLHIEKGIFNIREYEEHENISYSDLFEDESLYFSFDPQNLPKLKKLTYINQINNFDSIIAEFLRLNPQLSYLRSSEDAFTISLVDQVSLQPELKQLAIIKEHKTHPPILISDYSALISIEYLEIVIDNTNIEFYKKIIQACPNVIQLHFKNENSDTQSYPMSCSIFNQLTKLQTLSINGVISPPLILWINKQGSNLTRLNLIETKIDHFDLSLVLQLSNIRHIYVSYDTRFSLQCISIIQGLDIKYLDWKTLIFCNSASFYKVSN